MIDKLFSSKARVEILKLFLFNPQDSFYQRQISAITHQPIRGVQREVAKLESIGLIENLFKVTVYIIRQIKNVLSLSS